MLSLDCEIKSDRDFHVLPVGAVINVLKVPMTPRSSPGEKRPCRFCVCGQVAGLLWATVFSYIKQDQSHPFSSPIA